MIRKFKHNKNPVEIILGFESRLELKSKIKNKVLMIDNLQVDGDYIESQAFAFLAIRSYLDLPISFPSTTNCKEPSLGGTIIKY